MPLVVVVVAKKNIVGSSAEKLPARAARRYWVGRGAAARKLGSFAAVVPEALSLSLSRRIAPPPFASGWCADGSRGRGISPSCRAAAAAATASCFFRVPRSADRERERERERERAPSLYLDVHLSVLVAQRHATRSLWRRCDRHGCPSDQSLYLTPVALVFSRYIVSPRVPRSRRAVHATLLPSAPLSICIYMLLFATCFLSRSGSRHARRCIYTDFLIIAPKLLCGRRIYAKANRVKSVGLGSFSTPATTWKLITF